MAATSEDRVQITDSRETSLDTVNSDSTKQLLSSDALKLALHNDVLFVAPSDNPSTSLVTSLLDESNFVGWELSIKMALEAKNKLGLIDGTVPCPPAGTTNYERWLRADFLVRSCILNSMTPRIKETFRTANSSQKLWEEIQVRYAESNAPQIFELKRTLNAVTQQNRSITEYFGQLKKLWEELAAADGLPVCSCGALNSCTCKFLEKLVEREERDKLMQFLSGLNEAYENIIDNILTMDILPHINRAFHIALQVERKKKSLIHLQGSQDAVAMAVNVSNSQGNKNTYNASYGKKDAKPDAKKARVESREIRYALIAL